MKTCKRLDLDHELHWGRLQECGQPAFIEYVWHFAELTRSPEIRGTTPMCRKHYEETVEDTLPSPARPELADNLVPLADQWRKL
jgi:hypothetical protein